VHIKTRLNLLRNGQATGVSTQHSAPVPQDIHPQQYQAAGVGQPPGPQWGLPPPGPGPQNPGPPPTGPDWNRRLAAMENPNPQPQGPMPYQEREPIRLPPQPRQPSPPRQDHLRQYPEPHRHTPVRRPSPSPTSNHAPPVAYPQGLPPPPQPPTSAPTRIVNPNYGVSAAGIPPPPMPGHVGAGPMPPYARGNSPPPEIRPIADDRVSSPASGYPHQAYHHASTSQPANIMTPGAPLPAALAAADATALRERDERPSAAHKRPVDAEDEYRLPNKKPANGDIRGRLEDHHYRGSSQEKPLSPSNHRRNSSESRREDHRRATDGYHPSDASHHPQALPPIQQQQKPLPQLSPPQQAPLPPSRTLEMPPQEPLPPALPDVPREERREERFEKAARKVEIDEDYDEPTEDDKRAVEVGGRSSPATGPVAVNGQAKTEPLG
jgi:hypothetical protein